MASTNHKRQASLVTRWLSSLLAALGLMACSPEAPPPAPNTSPSPPPSSHASLAGSRGVVEPPADGRPPIVVSLDPLASRLVLALGARDRVVAGDAASRALPEFAGLTGADLSNAPVFEPTVVLTGALGTAALARAEGLREAGIRVIEFAPHDLEEVAEAIREIGGLLVGHVRAMRFETELTRPLAAIGGASHGQPRPRTLAVVSFDPLVVAGGHSFETDLIEIAGGQSVTHPGEDWRRTLAPGDWAAWAPDLVLVVSESALTPNERAAALDALPADVPVEFFEFEGPAFWLDAPTEPARRLRAIIERHAAALSVSR